MKGQDGKWKLMQWSWGLWGCSFWEQSCETHSSVHKDSGRNSKVCAKKYNSVVAKMIKDMKHSQFDFLVCPVQSIIANPDGTITKEKINEMDVYLWKKDHELVHNMKAEFIEKEKWVFPIILGQCSPSLRNPNGRGKNIQRNMRKKLHSSAIEAHSRILLQIQPEQWQVLWCF